MDNQPLYIRPSEKFGDEAVLRFASGAGLLPKEATVAQITEDLRKLYDADMEQSHGMRKKLIPTNRNQ